MYFLRFILLASNQFMHYSSIYGNLLISAIKREKHSHLGSCFNCLVSYFYNIKFLIMYNYRKERSDKRIELRKRLFGATNMKRRKYIAMSTYSL